MVKVALNILLTMMLTSVQGFAADGASGHDYFTANENPGIQHYLYKVDNAHTNKVLGSIHAERLNVAIGDLKYTLARFPNHPKALSLLKTVAQLTKNSALGIAYYERAIKLYPQYALTHAQYGDYLVAIGQLEAGIEKLLMSTEMDNKLVFAYVGLAKAYYRRGDLEHAKRAAAEARALNYKGKIPAEVAGE